MWQALQGTWLWARFARAKYYQADTFVKYCVSSPLWNSIVSHLTRLLKLTQWAVGHGDISFWGDNWIGEPLYGPLPCDLQLTLREAQPILPQLLELIYPRHHTDIYKVVLRDEHSDKLVFTPSDDGKFSLC